MSGDHYIVVGSGPAGHEAARTLREKAAGDARVTLVSGHHGGCYRPHLLPKFIAGEVSEEQVYVSPPSAYKDQGIKLRTGQRVTGLDPGSRSISFDHKEVLPFTGVIIAVGGMPRVPEPLRAFEDLLTTLKTIEDAKTWVRRLATVDSVLVIGGDLTSLALTRTLLKLNKRVTFMLNEDAFWPLRCGEEVFQTVADRLRAEGVEVVERGRIKSVARLSEVACEVRTEGSRLEAGMIGAFFGLVPDVRFLGRSGLSLDRGVLVDEYLNAGFEGVYAAGDCAQVYHPQLRDYWVSVGHDNAVALGRTAAMNLLGCRIPAEASAKSIFDVEGIKVNTSWWMEF